MAVQPFFRLVAFVSSSIWPPKNLQPSNRKDSLWAIVTGSTSGLGLALSSELCRRGFDVIIHGRDEEKLKSLQLDLLHRFPSRKCEILLLDAETCFSRDEYDASHDAISSAVKDHSIALLINNVGIGHSPTKDFQSLTRQTATSIDLLLNTNIAFMTHLTRLLLPVLSSSAPSLIINIGSLAELAMPYLAVYSSTKAYISTFTKALDAEMRAEGLNVAVECMLLGDIDTPSHSMKESISVLGAEHAAQCILNRAGSMGRFGLEPVGAPYWFHGFLLWVCQIQPWWMLRAGFIQNLKSKSDLVKRE